MRRPLLVFSEPACREHDTDWLLDALEDPRRHVRLMAFRRTIDHPNVRTRPPQVVAHSLEAWSIEKAGDRDETDDPFLVRIRHAGRGLAP